MNAYKDMVEGLITEAEYNTICRQEAEEYAEEMRRKWAQEESEDWEDFEDDEDL